MNPDLAPKESVYSSSFPEGYGDLPFMSSNGVTFHFPRFLLAHASPVFKDMVELGENANISATLTLAEDHKTLEYLLCVIDPAQDFPHLDWDYVARLLSAADKYQMKTVTQWFEKEVAVQMLSPAEISIGHLCLCLNLACAFELDGTMNRALERLVKCPLSNVATSSNDHKQGAIEGLLNRRSERILWLIEAILSIDGDITSRSGLDKCPFHRNGNRGWVRAALKGVVRKPSWAALIRAAKCPKNQSGMFKCTCEQPTISVSWMKKALDIEASSPLAGES
ncbi:10484_t:CDS:1 [Acaulospora colombiana]|uniref:10484_t:CDS:1 n=1 Tax=Acaulospora colombiana TaxID=27376 RepID=A0ACA9NWM6_9GLOM|nr:10484_t:CDS:1 [Acaulospora colombiana]